MTEVSKTGAVHVSPRKEARSVFHVVIAALIALVVFAGFAPTYYLRSYGNSPPLPMLVHLHGALFTSWIILFVAQTALIAAHRTDIHKRLGVVGGFLAASMIVVGSVTAITAARRGHSGLPSLDNLSFLLIPLGDLVIFLVLIAAGFHYRRQSNIHRRMMLLATVSLLSAAIGRLPVIDSGPAVLFLFGMLAFAGPVHERLSYGRFRRTYVLAALAVWVSLPLRVAIGSTELWRRFAAWLIR